jgi:lipopolysaccharide transport system permease protein
MNMPSIEELSPEAVSQSPLEEQHAPEAFLPDKPVVLNESDTTHAAFNLRDIWAYRELLFFLTWRDIKVRYKQTAIGAAWAIIQPLLIVIVFAVFFGLLIGVPTEGMPFIVFFYCAMLPWMFFSTALTLSSGSLINSSNLITKIYFPRAIIPIAAVAAGLIDLLITTAILVGMLPFYGIRATAAGFLMLPALLFVTLCLSTAFGILLSALTVKYRDIRHALPFVLQIWMYVTPLVYPLTVIPEKWRWLMYINPLTGVVEGIRSAVWGKPFNWTAIGISLVITILMLFVSASAFRRIENSFADLI